MPITARAMPLLLRHYSERRAKCASNYFWAGHTPFAGRITKPAGNQMMARLASIYSILMLRRVADIHMANIFSETLTRDSWERRGLIFLFDFADAMPLLRRCRRRCFSLRRR